MSKISIIRRRINQLFWEYKNRNNTKIFCIGFNKTGTTSLKVALTNLGYKIGNQIEGEKLLKDWQEENYKPIIEYCYSAEAFQDVPFSLPGTYKVLDTSFPNGKFILTVRDTPQQWYNSITTYHSKRWGVNGELPTKEDLENARYRHKGWAWNFINSTFKTPDSDPYLKTQLVQIYEKHIENVKQYFKDRPEDLLILNVSQKNAYKLLTGFLGKEIIDKDFPKENVT